MSELPAQFSDQYLRKLECKQISSRRSFLGDRQGGHFSLKRGHGIEFADYRKYEMGDDPRHIDWKLYGRSERFYIKRFREEEDLLVHIFVDTSNSMFTPEISKWERVVDLVLSIVYIAGMQQDPVQISLPGYLPRKKFRGRSMIYTVNRDFQNFTFNKNIDFFSEVNRSVSGASFPGVAYFISDFLGPVSRFKAVLNSLLSKNLDIQAIQVLGEHDAKLDISGKASVVDSETSERVEIVANADSVAEYQSLLNQHQRELRDFCRKRRITWQTHTVSDNLEDFIIKQL